MGFKATVVASGSDLARSRELLTAQVEAARRADAAEKRERRHAQRTETQKRRAEMAAASRRINRGKK